jgi:hypothetical protein
MSYLKPKSYCTDVDRHETQPMHSVYAQVVRINSYTVQSLSRKITVAQPIKKLTAFSEPET